MFNLFKKKKPEFDEGDMKIEPYSSGGKKYWTIYIYESERWHVHDVARTLQEADELVSHMRQPVKIYKKDSNNE